MAQENLKPWQESVNQESVDKALAAGKILPKLDLPKTGDQVTVKYITEPKLVKSEKLAGEKGEAYFADVEHEGANMSLVQPGSLLFHLSVEMKRNNLSTVVDQSFIIGANTVDHPKYGKDTKMYWAQFKG